MKVIPYETKGKSIREMSIKTFDEATRVKRMFLKEDDKWLKKMLAMKLLEFENLDLLDLNKRSLLESTQCQIEL